MNLQSAEPHPAIDDRYWFDFSKTLIDSSILRREAAADALQKLVIWLWSIYTAAAAVGFTLSGKQLEFWPTLIIATPSGLLILVYWGTVWVQMPKIIEFDPRSPTEIKQAHDGIVLAKSRLLSLTLLISMVAAIMVSIGLVVASVSKPPRFAPPTFQAAFERNDGETVVGVMAHVDKVPTAQLRLTPMVNSTPMEGETILMTVIPTEDGLIQTSARMRTVADVVRVELTWDSGSGVHVQLSRTYATRDAQRAD